MFPGGIGYSLEFASKQTGVFDLQHDGRYEPASPVDHEESPNISRGYEFALRRQAHGGIPAARRPARAVSRGPDLVHGFLDEAI